MSSELCSDPPAPYIQRVDQLIKDWNDLTVYPPARVKGGPWVKQDPLHQHAYLLFNRWDENPLARSLEDEFPKWARDRVAVPDRQFDDDPDQAPCILELPEELILAAPSSEGRAIRHWLASCLEFTTSEVNRRTRKQDFCGAVISPASAQAITRHWVGLGDQRPPFQAERVLFRYHDPRVMQRVWPALNPRQQSKWLGPVTHWWSLLQPWGPFEDSSEPPDPLQWFQAKTPVLPHGTLPGGSPRDLFDESQWFLSHSSRDTNRIWRGYADSHIAPEAQPDPTSLLQMLEDAARLGLQGLNAEDYVWITWQHAPKEGAPHALDWSLPHMAPILSQIQTQARARPGLSFSKLLNQFVKFPG
jgi:hypothetical protein